MAVENVVLAPQRRQLQRLHGPQPRQPNRWSLRQSLQSEPDCCIVFRSQVSLTEFCRFQRSRFMSASESRVQMHTAVITHDTLPSPVPTPTPDQLGSQVPPAVASCPGFQLFLLELEICSVKWRTGRSNAARTELGFLSPLFFVLGWRFCRATIALFPCCRRRANAHHSFSELTRGLYRAHWQRAPAGTSPVRPVRALETTTLLETPSAAHRAYRSPRACLRPLSRRLFTAIPRAPQVRSHKAQSML